MGMGQAPGPQTGQFNDPFDAPKFGGPYSAPLTQGQMDSLQGFNRLFNGNPLLQTQDLRKGIEFALSGGPIYHPNAGKSLTEQVEPFRLPSAATEALKTGVNTGFMPGQLPNNSDLSGVNEQINKFLKFDAPKTNPQNVLNTMSGIRGNAPTGSFDQTEMFKSLGDVMQGQLDDVMAQTREEYSGLGLGPGATDRAMGLTRAGGDVLSKFNLQKAMLGEQSFENAAQRQLASRGQDISMVPLQMEAEQLPFNQALAQTALQGQALPAALQTAQLPFQQSMQVAENILRPAAENRLRSAQLLSEQEDKPFERFYQVGEGAAMRSLGALPHLFELEQRPFDRFAQQYAMNEQGRRVAQGDIDRRMAEFARTQGMTFQQLMQLLSSSKPMELGIGPSTVSQIAGLLEGIGRIFGAVKGGG